MGKKFEAAVKQIDKPAYTLGDAMPLIKKVAFAKFDEMVDVSIRLGVDPKHADQMVRGTVVLPHGLGKTLRVIAIASGDKVREAREAGADEVGGDDLVQQGHDGRDARRARIEGRKGGVRRGQARNHSRRVGQGFFRRREAGGERPGADRERGESEARHGQGQVREKHCGFFHHGARGHH